MIDRNTHWSTLALVGAFLITPVGAASTAKASEPAVQGPIPGHPALNLGQFKMEDLGYVVEEFFDARSGFRDSIFLLGQNLFPALLNGNRRRYFGRGHGFIQKPLLSDTHHVAG